jgi:hypothetical protein
VGVNDVLAHLPAPLDLGVRSWRLPGDIAIQRDGYSFYFPLGTSILISIVLTLLLTFWAWLSARGR